MADISQDYRNDINFICGSIEECGDPIVSEILKAHGYTEKDFGYITPDEDLVQDLYQNYFIKLGRLPFLPD